MGVTCPLCEEYSAEEPGSVIAHISSKVDTDHKGVGGQKARELLDINGNSADTDSGTDPDTDTDQPSPTSAITAAPESETDSTDEATCPSCGKGLDCSPDEAADMIRDINENRGHAKCTGCGHHLSVN